MSENDWHGWEEGTGEGGAGRSGRGESCGGGGGSGEVCVVRTGNVSGGGGGGGGGMVGVEDGEVREGAWVLYRWGGAVGSRGGGLHLRASPRNNGYTTRRIRRFRGG